MNISKKELQAALEIVKPGLANKELIQQATSFAFIKGRVVTYNDEVSISHPVSGLDDFEGAVKADEFYKILNKLKEDDVEITLQESELILKSGRAKAGLTIQSEIKLPLDEDISEKGKWKDIPENFIKFLGFAASSCSKEMATPLLTAVHCNKSGVIEASDNYRVTHCLLEEDLPVQTFLLPASSAVTVVRLCPTQIAEGRGWIHFKTEEDTILSCRVLDEDYPDTAGILNVQGELITLPTSLEDSLDKAGVFAKRDQLTDETVEISLENRRLTITSRSETGWFEESINIKYDKEPLSFFITPYLLKGILSETQGCYFNEDRLKFQGNGWVYVAMLKVKGKK